MLEYQAWFLAFSSGTLFSIVDHSQVPDLYRLGIGLNIFNFLRNNYGWAIQYLAIIKWHRNIQLWRLVSCLCNRDWFYDECGRILKFDTKIINFIDLIIENSFYVMLGTSIRSFPLTLLCKYPEKSGWCLVAQVSRSWRFLVINFWDKSLDLVRGQRSSLVQDSRPNTQFSRR